MKPDPQPQPETALGLMLSVPEHEASMLRCSDGHLSAGDVARVAGVKRKDVIRAINAYCGQRSDTREFSGGAVMSFRPEDLPDPATQSRAEMARAVAERIGVGRFGLKRRIAERAAEQPQVKPKGRGMSATHHPWTIGKHGRSARSEQGGGVVTVLTCSRCPATETIRFRQLADSEAIDRKFAQKGWAVDPARCPAHNRRNHQTKKDTASMATEAPTFAAPTPAAIAAQAKMFGLLQTHFDPDTGVYGSGYSDQKIADECRLALDLVTGVRRQAFGELKVPSEVAQLTADIEALEGLLEEATVPIRSELASLKRRVAECCKKFGG